jgi:hypothetical protein
MFKGPEGFKGGMKSLLGGTSSTEGGMKGVMKGFDTLDSFDTFDMNTTSEVNSLPFAKFGTKLPLEMELMPENGKMVDGYLHKEGGVITKHRGKPVAEIEGGEGITKGGVVFSDTTINPETGKPFSKDAKKVIKIKDENTRRLAEEELYIKQEKAKEMQGLVNRGEEMAMKKYKKGGSLKAIPSDNKGLPQLPESVRNQMGYMKSDGGLRAKIHVKNKIRVKDKSKGKSAKPRNNNYTMDEYNSFENYAGNARQTLSTNDVARLNELGFTKTYNLNDFSRGFNKLQQPGGTLDQDFLPNFKGGGKASKSGKELNLPTMAVDGTSYYKTRALNRKNNIFSDIKTGVTETGVTERSRKEREKREGERRERREGEGGEGGEGNLTPGDIAQLAGNMVAPLANLAAMKGIGENVVDYGKDRSITREQRVSTADVERAARQEGAATRAGLTDSPALKSAIATGTTKAIQDAILQGERLNRELGMRGEQARTQRSQFNVKQEDLTKESIKDREDLRTTTGLTAAEQTGKALVDLGLTKNQGLTNSAQLKVLQEAFPDFTITQDNMKSVIRALGTGKEENIIKYRKPKGE